LPRKKKPSQVAHAETPKPMSFVSLSMPSRRAEAPVATITLFAWYSASSVVIVNGRREKSTREASVCTISAPKRAAWSRMISISSGPMTPSRKPG
jgi:hypothetical protein